MLQLDVPAPEQMETLLVMPQVSMLVLASWLLPSSLLAFSPLVLLRASWLLASWLLLF